MVAERGETPRSESESLAATDREWKVLRYKMKGDYYRDLAETTDVYIQPPMDEIVGFGKHVPQEQVQYIDKTVDVPIVKQVHIPTVEVPEAQFPNRVTDDSVLIPGTIAQFELYHGEDDKSSAARVQIRALNVAESQSMLGWVKSFRDKCCFITSDCVQGDIFLAKGEIQDEWNLLHVGVPLRFRLVPGRDRSKTRSAKMLVMTFRNFTGDIDGSFDEAQFLMQTSKGTDFIDLSGDLEVVSAEDRAADALLSRQDDLRNDVDFSGPN